MARAGAEIPSSLLERLAVAVAGAAGLSFLAFIAASILYGLVFWGRILPGVSVAGTDLSGIGRADAAALLSEQIRYPQQGQIALTYNGQFWIYKPEQLGYTFDAEATIDDAYRVGRTGWPWERWAIRLFGWQSGADVPPQMTFDERQAQTVLEGIAAQIYQPSIEASLAVNGLDVAVQSGQIGRSLDIPATLSALRAQLASLQDGAVPLAFVEQPPVILDASAQAELAREILRLPLVLKTPEGGAETWTLQPQTLAGMLIIERVRDENSEHYQVALDSNQLRAFLLPLAADLLREPENARFIFNDETRQLDLIQNAVIGRALNIAATIEQINAQLEAGQHTIDLVFDYADPLVADNATATDLGITQLVSEQSTYFYGSSAGRIQNIQTASARFHGLLVPPGGTFSMGENLGDVSLDSGYAEALIIFGDRTIQGVGGGVCQVSTTLFRTVFFGGFPILERWPHAYRVYYYELAQSGAVNENLAGLDATVYTPLVDFKFQNDTPYWLLMETYVNVAARSLTWKFYSTSDGRTVDWSTSGLQNVVEPPDTVYEENEELGKGEIEQVDWAVEGADVTITRMVYRDGQIIIQDQFSTHYEPWATVCEYGPGTKDYPPKPKDQDKYSCAR